MGVFVAHTDLTLWVFLGSRRSHRFLLMVGNLTEAGGWGVSECSDFKSSHRFNEIQREDYLWEFVLICG